MARAKIWSCTLHLGWCPHEVTPLCWQLMAQRCITSNHEPVPVGSHESNGAAEATLQQIPLRAGMWIQQIENQCAGGKTIFPCTHPLFAWALLHSSWVYNRHRYVGHVWRVFFELLENRQEGSSKVAERNLVGKVIDQRYAHHCSWQQCLCVTRSIRRLPTPFVLEELGEVIACPWDYGFAALGHRLLHAEVPNLPTDFLLRTSSLELLNHHFARGRPEPRPKARGGDKFFL